MVFFLLRREPPPGTGQSTVGAASDANQSYPAYQEFCTVLGIDATKGVTSFSERVRRDYRLHTLQYWLVASFANGLLWAQIVIGAALTALGATHTPGAKTATIYLGASSTIIAGLLTYFKSRNQPNRARQYRQALRGVRNKMDEAADDVLNSTTPEEARQIALGIIKQYDDALKDAAVNYPDLWVSIASLEKFFPKPPPKPKPHAQLMSGGRGDDSHPGGDSDRDELPGAGSHLGEDSDHDEPPGVGSHSDPVHGGARGESIPLAPLNLRRPVPPNNAPLAAVSRSPADVEAQ
jgi:SMODS and SLOG-associating 2TM effector domain